MFDIFCPRCDTLILDLTVCPTCHWRRPTARGSVGEIVWQADLRAKLNKPHCYPVVATGLYCLGTEDGDLVALDSQSGEIVWERVLDADMQADTLATDGATLFVGGATLSAFPASGRALVALDAATGEERWRHTTDAHSLSAASVAEEGVFFTTSDGRLRCLNPVNGAVRWSTAHAAWGPAPPLVRHGLVYAGGRDNVLRAYDARNGTPQWEFRAEHRFIYPLVADAQTVYALTQEGPLYALDLQTDRVRWQLAAEWGRGFTTPPALDPNEAPGGRILLGNRVNREVKGEQRHTYAMVAYHARDGAESWRYFTQADASTPPTAVEGHVYFGTNDGNLYCVNSADGSLAWQVKATSRAVTDPQVADNLVIFGGRDGMVRAVRRREASTAHLVSPVISMAAGNYEAAAIAYALQHDFVSAAKLYVEKLGDPEKAHKLYLAAKRPGEAAELLEHMGRYRAAAERYEEAGDKARAASAWEQAGDRRRARDLYRETEDWQALVRVLERLEGYLEAAQIAEEVLQDFAKAARLYGLGENHAKEAELYFRAGMRLKGMAAVGKIAEWERAVELLIRKEDFQVAAYLFERHQRLRRAKTLYMQAGARTDALRVAKGLGAWEDVALLAEAIKDYRQAAEAWRALKNDERAARAYEDAAKATKAEGPADEEDVADLYQRAAKHYQAIHDFERTEACLHWVRYYRRLPELKLEAKSIKGFIEGEFNTLQVIVTNQGWAPAYNIQINIGGNFDVQGETDMPGLQHKVSRPLELSVRPHAGCYGEAAAMKIELTYEEADGTPRTVSSHHLVEVAQGDVLAHLFGGATTTPLSIDIQEVHHHSRTVTTRDYAEGGQTVSGDLVTDEAHRMDRVALDRPSTPSSANRADNGPRFSVRESVGPVRRCPECNVPTRNPDLRHCSECGTALPPLDENPTAP